MSSAKRRKQLKNQKFIFNIVKVVVGCLILIESAAIYHATISNIYRQPYQPKPAISTLVHALNERNPSLLAPVLASEYSVGPLTGAMAQEALNQIVRNYPHTIRSYSVPKDERQVDGTYDVEVLMTCSAGERKNRFKLNEAGAFIEISLIDPASATAKAH